MVYSLSTVYHEEKSNHCSGNLLNSSHSIDMSSLFELSPFSLTISLRSNIEYHDITTIIVMPCQSSFKFIKLKDVVIIKFHDVHQKQLVCHHKQHSVYYKLNLEERYRVSSVVLNFERKDLNIF